MATAETPLRVGVMGTANIAKKNARAIYKSKRCTLVAVASRTKEKAAAWAEVCKAYFGNGQVCTFDSYEKLINCEDIDAIYMPLPTKLHMEWVPRVAAAKKHILLEKPLALDAGLLREMLDACASNGVRLMDGTMFVHNTRHAALLESLSPSDAKIKGTPNRVTACVSLRGDESFFKSDIRLSPEGDPLGCVGDVGWYCVRVALEAFNWLPPTSVHALCLQQSDAGVPTDVQATIHFGDDPSTGTPRVLNMQCSFHHSFRQWVEIETTGDRTLTINDLMIARSEHGAEPLTQRTHFGMADFATRVNNFVEEVPFAPCCQEANMWDDFAAACIDGAKPGVWEQHSLRTQAVLDTVVRALKLGGAAMVPGPLPGWD